MSAEALFQQVYKKPYTASPQDMELMTQLLTKPKQAQPWAGGNMQGQGPILGPQDSQSIPSAVPVPAPPQAPQAPGFAQLIQSPHAVQDRMHELEVARGHRMADAEAQNLVDNRAVITPVQLPELTPGQNPEQMPLQMVDVTDTQVPKDAPYGIPAQAPQAPQGMAQMLDPQQGAGVPAQAPSPPASPEEFEQRRQGWTQVLTTFMQQPQAQQILMQVGLKLLQGRQPGESLGQQFGAALGTGVQAKAMLEGNVRADAETQRKQGMEDQKHDLDVRRGTAQADKAEAENDFYSKTRAQALEEINLGIENLKTTGKLREAQLIEQNLQNGNLPEAHRLAMADKRSSIWARGEQVKIQRKNADKVPAAGQARADMLQLVKDAYPQEAGESEGQYKQRIAQIQIQLNSTSKGNNVTELLKLAELTDDDTEREELLAQAKAGIQGRQVPAAKPATGTPAVGRGGTSSASMTFPSIDAYNKAAAAGKIKDGTRVNVNGRLATHRAN